MEKIISYVTNVTDKILKYRYSCIELKTIKHGKEYWKYRPNYKNTGSIGYNSIVFYSSDKRSTCYNRLGSCGCVYFYKFGGFLSVVFTFWYFYLQKKIISQRVKFNETAGRKSELLFFIYKNAAYPTNVPNYSFFIPDICTVKRN